MDAIADLADELSFGEIVVTHEQNLVLPHVEHRSRPPSSTARLVALGLRHAQPGAAHQHDRLPRARLLLLANARSIPVSQRIAERFDDLDRLHDIGPLDLNISGCINACGHHHAGHIGILGVNRHGEEYYQVIARRQSGERRLDRRHPRPRLRRGHGRRRGREGRSSSISAPHRTGNGSSIPTAASARSRSKQLYVNPQEGVHAKVIANGEVIETAGSASRDDAPVPAEGDVIVSLARWMARARDACRAQGRHRACGLAGADRLDAILQDPAAASP